MRVVGWESKLAQYLREPGEFRWGSRDCALWAAGWVATCTGHDHRSGWLGRYRTGVGATRAMRKRGFACPADIASHHLEEIPIRMARRGDLILYPTGVLGICNGLLSHFLAETGHLSIDTLACHRAWRVD